MLKDAITIACARAAHEANRAYCLALGDETQAPWHDAPDWQKESAIEGVAGALEGNSPERAHEAWREENRKTGWKYGPVKDPAKREHPCMVPYEQLPDEQKAKDALFIVVVRAMARRWRQRGSG